MNLNKVFLGGNVGQDVETKYTQAGNVVCNFSIAINEFWKTKDGKKSEKTTWVRVSCWGKLAESCGEYLSKGSNVFIEGKLVNKSWTDKSGNKRNALEIEANTVQFLGGKKTDDNIGNELDEQMQQAIDRDQD